MRIYVGRPLRTSAVKACVLPDPPGARSTSRCRGAELGVGWGGVQESWWELGASGRVMAGSSVLTAALGRKCYYFRPFSRFSRCGGSGPERPGRVLSVTQLAGDGWELNPHRREVGCLRLTIRAPPPHPHQAVGPGPAPRPAPPPPPRGGGGRILLASGESPSLPELQFPLP